MEHGADGRELGERLEVGPGSGPRGTQAAGEHLDLGLGLGDGAIELIELIGVARQGKRGHLDARVRIGNDRGLGRSRGDDEQECGETGCEAQRVRHYPMTSRRPRSSASVCPAARRTSAADRPYFLTMRARSALSVGEDVASQ